MDRERKGKLQCWLTDVCEALVSDFPLACWYGIVKYIYLASSPQDPSVRPSLQKWHIASSSDARDVACLPELSSLRSSRNDDPIALW